MSAVRARSPEAARLPTTYYAWLCGALASQLGDAVLLFALGWAASAHGGMWAGLVLTAIAAPRTVLLLAGGVVADRVAARSVMIVGDAVMLVLAAVLAVAAPTMGSPIWLLIAFAVLAGTVDGFYLPATGTMPRRLVADALVPRALALRGTGAQLLGLVGPPLAGVLVAWAGITGAASLDALTFAIVLAILIVVRPARRHPVPVPRPAERLQFVRDALEGLHLAFTDPVIRRALFLTAAVAGLALPVASLLVPLLVRAHGWSAGSAGFIMGCQAAGSIAVSAAVAKWGQRGRPLMVAAASTLPMGMGLVGLGLAAMPSTAYAAALLFGAGLGLFISHVGPLVLTASPETHISRVQSVVTLVQTLAILVTNNALGGLAQAASAAWAIGVCGALLALAGALVASAPAPGSDTNG